MKNQINCPFDEMMIYSKNLEVPRNAYQRELNPNRVRKIAAEFDEHIANDPKVSFRDGHYYVFDGQHTIAARKLRNGGQDLPIRCKVFYGLSELDEAILFAQQTGTSAQLTAGAKLRALIYGNDPDAVAFLKATEDVGLRLDYNQDRGKCRIGCVGTAYSIYKKVGEKIYKEGMQHIVNAWDGAPDSLRFEILLGVVFFVDLYHDEYSPKRLVEQLRRYDPLTIYREGRSLGVNMAGYKKYMYQVYRMYNGNSRRYMLPLKF